MAGRNDWETPPELFTVLDWEFGFTLDVCASVVNAKCPTFYDEATNGLAQSWKGHTCWMNPPYSVQRRNVLSDWLSKADRETPDGVTTVALVPNAQSERWWEHCERAAEIRTLAPRVPFMLPGQKRSSPPFGVAIVVFRRKLLEAPPLRWHWDWRSSVNSINSGGNRNAQIGNT